MPALSLVIPCYNEEKNIPELAERCRNVLARGDVEIILVDNGSRDATPKLLADAVRGQDHLRTVRVEVNQGYGYGILAGLKEARGDFLGWSHADLQTDPADALAGLELLMKHPDDRILVKGRRYGRPAADVFFTMGMSFFESLIFGALFWDVNAQPTLFSRGLYQTWKNPPHDFALDLYAYRSAQRAGYAIRRFPVYFGPRLHGTVSRWNIGWKSKAKMIRRVIGYSWQLRRKPVN